jgi:hypothetical protein
MVLGYEFWFNMIELKLVVIILLEVLSIVPGRIVGTFGVVMSFFCKIVRAPLVHVYINIFPVKST